MFRMSFANFLDLIAYVDVQGYFWIADITTIPRLLVFSGKDYPWDDVRINWTPDDRHLIVEFGHPDYQDQIFHLESGEWETWDSICDTVAHSPRTDRLAIWCYSSAKKAYTIFEWGGEVWTSVQPPEQVLFIASPPDRWDTFGSFLLYRNAGWSSGGEMIAYYDPEDATGALQIVTLRGEEVLRVPEKAYWLTDFYKEGRSVPGIPLQWSLDSARLLLLGIGKPGQECPEFDDEDTVYRNPGCWQVLDLASGTVMWQATNLYPWQEPTVLSMHFYTNPTISGSGQYVAIDAPFDIEPLFLWDVESGEMLNNLPYDIEKMRWGRVP
jgi:hypothetical protein